MAFQLSPGVEIQERDLTGIIPAVATTGGGFCGAFIWGPVNERVLVDSERTLRTIFGAAADDNAFGSTNGFSPSGATDYLTASEFLGYGNNLKVVRVVDSSTAYNANAGNTTGLLITNEDNWETQYDSGIASKYGNFVAKYPGALGNSISVSICDNLGTTTARVYRVVVDAFYAAGGTVADSDGYDSVPAVDPSIGITDSGVGTGLTKQANAEFKLISKVLADDGTYTFYLQEADGADGASFESQLTGGATTADFFLYFSDTILGRIKKDTNNLHEIYGTTTGNLFEGTAFGAWKYKNSFEGNPGTSNYASNVGGSNDEMHIVVYDSDGLWTGTPGTILERFSYVSKARDAKNADGTNNYFVEVIREQSQYVWVASPTFPTDTAGTAGSTFTSNANNTTYESFGVRDFNLGAGANGNMPGLSSYVTAYNTYFADPDTVDISLLIGNGASSRSNATTLAQTLISIANSRLDCIACLSPALADVTGNDPLTSLIDFRNTLGSTSYAVMNSGWKKRYDAANDVDRWVPLSADIAGTMVRTDRLADPWFSPAGFNRGQIRNVLKLAFNPTKVQRDRLYSAGINPVATFPGEGTVLYGDKTMLTRPSGFDRINVRRLFIIIEKAIATASKYVLFEFNDEFTRKQFLNLVEPFLRDIQGRRGIFDYRVIADTTNNTPQVIDSNNFVADIFIKPNRSINYINLNFIQTPTGISFEEIGA